VGFLGTLVFWIFIVPGLCLLGFGFMLIGAYFPEKTLAVGSVLMNAVVTTVQQIITVILA